MTAQREDSIIWMNKRHNLLGLLTPLHGSNTEGTTEAPFQPQNFGMAPDMMGTDCYRGYCCIYKIVRNKLYVDQVDIRTKDKKRPQINGVKPTTPDGGFTKQYKKIGLFLPYTGKLRIVNDLIANRFRNMGFQETTSYRTVIDLDFKDGQVDKVDDLSRVISIMRDAQSIVEDYTENNWMTYEWHAKLFENYGIVDDDDIDDMFEQYLRRLQPQILFSLLNEVIQLKREPIWFIRNYEDYYQRNCSYKNTLQYLKFIGLPERILGYLSKCGSRDISEKQVVVSFMNALLETKGSKYWGETMRVIIANQFKMENGNKKLKSEIRKKLAGSSMHSWGRHFKDLN